MKGKGGAPRGNRNAAGRHKGASIGKSAIPDTRTNFQKIAQSKLLGIKRDTSTGKLYAGNSLKEAEAKDKATAARYNKYKSQNLSTAGKITREVIFAVKKK